MTMGWLPLAAPTAMVFLMTHLLAAVPGGQIGQVLSVVNSPYPPSFDNNPSLFAVALFARLLIVLLASATIVRIASRNRSERIAANHPVYYHRMTVSCFLMGSLLGASSDVLTYLFWGETSERTAAVLFTVGQVLNALTMLPFMMALFVPFWVRFLCRVGVFRPEPSLTLGGRINDLRTTWDTVTVPAMLLCYSAVSAAFITVGKYWLWIEHGRP